MHTWSWVIKCEIWIYIFGDSGSDLFHSARNLPSVLFTLIKNRIPFWKLLSVIVSLLTAYITVSLEANRDVPFQESVVFCRIASVTLFSLSWPHNLREINNLFKVKEQKRRRRRRKKQLQTNPGRLDSGFMFTLLLWFGPFLLLPSAEASRCSKCRLGNLHFYH